MINKRQIRYRAIAKFVYFQHFSSRSTNLLLCAEPKSGSSFLYQVLGNLPGLRRSDFLPSYGHREQLPTQFEMSAAISARAGRNVVARALVKANEELMSLASQFNVRFLVQTRSLADILASRLDHLNSYSTTSSICHISDQHWRDLSEEEKLRYVTKYFAPWHIDFRYSWLEAAETATVPISWVTYESSLNNPAALRRSLGEIGFAYSDQEVSQALQLSNDGAKFGKTMFNQGVIGRGAELESRYPWLAHELRELELLQPQEYQDRFRI